MFKHIVHELKAHSPFTFFGALTGIFLMIIFKDLPQNISYPVFYVLHPGHIFLSAFVTTAIYCRYKPKSRESLAKKWWKILLVGYVGSVGIGTLSDSLIPLWGERLMGMEHAEAHIGFIEMWWLVNPLALAAIVLAYLKPATKFPHAWHVLLSTWASLFHMIMANDQASAIPYFGVFVFLFLAVWVPCCFSDIVFPLLFVHDPKDLPESHCMCSGH